jgi:hypothetical protein
VGYVGTLPGSILFEFRKLGDTAPFDTRIAAVALDGTYTVTAYTRQMDASVKTLSWLRRTVSVDASSGPVSGLDFAFTIGDTDGNNAVDIGDLNSVLIAFGQTDDPADVDGDGTVDLPDLNFVFVNFATVGDP